MKDYRKPELNLKKLCGQKELASLSQWLTDNQLTEAGITTYLIHS